MRATAGVLIDREERWNSTAFCIDPTQQMSRTLRRNHHNIDAGGGNDGFEMNAEAVGHAENLPRSQMWPNRRFIQQMLRLIWCENLHPIRTLGSICGSENLESVR